MKSSFKTAALALIAALAISAVAASAASAGTWKAESYPVKVSGEQTTQLLFSGVVGVWKCTGLTVQGELAGESGALDLAPVYTGCSWAGIAATINMEGCTYEYTAGNTVEGNKDKVQMTMDVRCPAGKEAKLTLFNGCTIRIPEQTSLGSATAQNTGAAELRSVDLKLEITGMTYTVENGSKCPNTPANGKYTNGALSGEINLVGSNPESGKPVGLTVE